MIETLIYGVIFVCLLGAAAKEIVVEIDVWLVRRRINRILNPKAPKPDWRDDPLTTDRERL
jgi:hypothetical protein